MEVAIVMRTPYSNASLRGFPMVIVNIGLVIGFDILLAGVLEWVFNHTQLPNQNSGRKVTIMYPNNTTAKPVGYR